MHVDYSDIVKRLKSKTQSIEYFNYDNMVAPPLLYYITPQDIAYLHYLATDIELSAKINYKYKEIDNVMNARGFVKLSAGTNRVCYRCLENQNIVLKIAIDDVGMKDNPREFINQNILKPFCTKIFDVSQCGTVALAERVINVRSRKEFYSIANDIYDIITQWIIGENIMDDIGTKYFMNWGVRDRFGPVLLDFPYLYKLDDTKLYCNRTLKDGTICGGVIDYDGGFNDLYCSKCGSQYKPIELRKLEKENKIVMKGSKEMEQKIKIVTKRGNKVVYDSDTVGTRKITKRERIYNSLPTVDQMIKVKVKPKKSIIQEAMEQSGIEIDDFYTESTFIPKEDEEPNRVDTVEDDLNIVNETVTIDPPEMDEESDDIENIDESPVEDIVDNEKDYEEIEDDDINDIPVGAVPVNRIKEKPSYEKKERRSQKFNPDFYTR